MRHDAVLAETTGIRGADDDLVEAYTARPMDSAARGGMVVIHHMPGFDRATKEIVRRFAAMGYDAICPNLYTREAPDAEPDDAAATARAQGGVPDARFVGDAAGAARWLRSLPTSNGSVGAIGFCSGGRQAVLAGLELDLQAAVDCYGAFVVGTPPAGFPLRVGPLADRIGELRAPLLGLFGNEDSHPSHGQVDELEKLLREHGKSYEFHRYDDAGHAFFAVDRPSYRVAAANDGWTRIADFLARHLSAERPTPCAPTAPRRSRSRSPAARGRAPPGPPAGSPSRQRPSTTITPCTRPTSTQSTSTSSPPTAGRPPGSPWNSVFTPPASSSPRCGPRSSAPPTT